MGLNALPGYGLMEAFRSTKVEAGDTSLAGSLPDDSYTGSIL